MSSLTVTVLSTLPRVSASSTETIFRKVSDNTFKTEKEEEEKEEEEKEEEEKEEEEKEEKEEEEEEEMLA
ncbi:hypothetical protein PoB_003452100 [Plakobranchus ocellatus]|uniref:Uncharacterized protein n=1 Tax=Plakobranchus ocellatus TaxID=259542 RepID=A0AAV4AI60_9GAST|nr:hypothetical protein PoB_003452100 [Plakobranchus ocellatus]